VVSRSHRRSCFAARAHSVDDPAASKRVALHILHCIEKLLSHNPELGRPGRVPRTRELFIPKTPFVVPYRVSNTVLEILRVYHHARRWPKQL
jgi:toxin ParE1/3/4